MVGGGETRLASDIREDAWILRRAPRPWAPYLRLVRLDRPIGTWLLLFPCWWSCLLAAGASGRGFDATIAWYLALFAIGALLMRGAGCTINDIVDRDIDGKVARTATRPLPSGEIRLRQALWFLFVQLALALVVLLQFNLTTIVVGLLSMLLVVPYPLMKRVTYWPQAWLGFTFNWGALVGWTAVTGELAWPAVLLYLGGVAWTLGYDTIYAHQDKEDDALIGVKSTALRLGSASKPWISFFYLMALLFFTAAAVVAEAGWPVYLALAAVAAHFLWQVLSLNTDDPAGCWVRFNANRNVGWLLSAGALASLFV